MSHSLRLVWVRAASGCAASHEDPQIVAEPTGATGDRAFAITTKDRKLVLANAKRLLLRRRAGYHAVAMLPAFP